MSEASKMSATIPSSSSASFFDPARLPPKKSLSFPDVPSPLPSATEEGDAGDDKRQLQQASASLTISSSSLPLVQQVGREDDGKEDTAEMSEDNVVDKFLFKSPASALNNLRTPSVTWKQNVDNVTLTVHIVDMMEYSLKVMPDHRTVSLRTTSPEGYGFDLVTFGRVASDFEVKTSGRYSTIVLQKFVNWMWMRLTKDKIRCRWIAADESNKGIFLKEEERDSDSEDEDNEEKAQGIREGMFRLFESLEKKPLNNAVDSDDEIGSDEEELLF